MGREYMTRCENVKKKPAVFLDQRGTIIDDSHRHRNYITTDSFFQGIFGALRKLQQNYSLFIVTNQSSVGLGLMSREDAERFNSEVKNILQGEGVLIVKTYACMHKREDKCTCIKPNPYFLLEAKKNYDIDLGNSFLIGDHPHDMECASNAGAKGLYVLTGHGEKHRSELTDDIPVFPSLAHAADFVCSLQE